MPNRGGEILELLKRIADALDAQQAEALDAAQAAALCNVSRAKWYGLDASGRIPEGVTIGNQRRWLRDELIAWLRAGAPARSTWRVRTRLRPEVARLDGLPKSATG